MKIIDVYKNAVKRLGEAGIENPAFDAKILFEKLLNIVMFYFINLPPNFAF